MRSSANVFTKVTLGVLTLGLLWGTACTRPLQIEGRDCPCDGVDYTCCPATGRCVPLGERCEPAGSEPDAGPVGPADQGGDGRAVPADRMGADGPAADLGCGSPEAELIFDPPLVESVPGFDVCVGIGLRLAGDDQVIPLGQEHLQGFEGIDSKTYRPGSVLCPPGQGPLVLDPFANGEGALCIGVRYEGNHHAGLLPTRILPYQFEITSGPVTVNVGEATPIPVAFTFHDERFEPVSWENPYAHYAQGFEVEIEDRFVARAADGAIEGLHSGETTYVLSYLVGAKVVTVGPYPLVVP